MNTEQLAIEELKAVKTDTTAETLCYRAAIKYLQRHLRNLDGMQETKAQTENALYSLPQILAFKEKLIKILDDEIKAATNKKAKDKNKCKSN